MGRPAHDRQGRRRRRDEDRARRIGGAVRLEGLGEPVHLLLGREQAVHDDRGVVDPVAQQEPGGPVGIGHGPGRRRRQSRDLLKRALERFQDAVELHAHLIGERPAGVVVGRDGRAAGIGEVVGMVLRLEHVEDVGPERLGGPDHVRPRRVALSGRLEVAHGALDRDPVLDERVHELGRGGEIGLVGGDDVAARVAPGGLVEQRHVLCGHDALPAAPPARRVARGAVFRGRGLHRRDDLRMDRPAVATAALDRVLPHQVDVVEQRLAIA